MLHRALIAAALLVSLSAAPASAELSQKGDLFVRFDGGISPRALPREALAPISVRIEGTLRVLPGGTPPPLREIEIALNRAGRLSTKGLAACPRKRIELSTPAEALNACGTSLLGSGGIVAKTALVGQRPTPVRQSLLFFNAKERGHSVILAHLYQGSPVPETNIVSFSVRHASGPFGTVVKAKLPYSLNANGYLTSIFLTLGRRYSYEGGQRSYLSASCAAPSGFTTAVFPFARASLGFADGRHLSATLIRSCGVR